MAEKGEQRKSYEVIKDFKGLNTKSNRTTIDKNEFAWIENAMPIGLGNVKIVPNVSNVGNVTFANTVIYLSSGVIGTTDYLIAVEANGRCEYVDLTNNSVGNVAPAGTFSNAGVQISQWKNERLLFIDPINGYSTWDGTNLVSVGSVGNINITAGGSGYTSNPNVTIGAPNQTGGIQAVATATRTGNTVTGITITERGTGYTSAPNVTISGGGGNGATANATLFTQVGTGIQSFSGRVWIANDRTVFYSAADSYNDFTSVSAGNITLTDATLHGKIVQILSANNFLYIFGDDSINVFSDVRVTELGTTLFTNTNVSASVGTRLKYAIFPYFRSVLFMNEYGVYALVGSTTSKLSDPLDGIFPYIDFTQNVTAGQVLLNNILCAAFNFTYNDPESAPRVVQAVFFEKKWFITSQGTLIWIDSTQFGGKVNLYATSGTDLKRLYADTSANITSTLTTALLPMGDPIRDKQALKFAFEATNPPDVPATFNVTVDSERGASPSYTVYNSVSWINNNLQTIGWVNNSSANVVWVATGYQLYKNDAQQWGKYLGLTITATSPQWVLHGIEFEQELRARF
jgi:hypothetical protein